MNLGLKICCISDRREVDLALTEGASALGFVGESPPGRGRLTDDTIAELIAYVGGRAPCWLLTVHTEPDALLAQVERTRPQVVQICDAVEPSVYAALAECFPALRRVQVIHVDGEPAIARAERVAPHVHAVLLDSGTPQGADRKLGGTGKTHDWSISRAIVARCAVPVWLAGGLHAGNVAEAIAQVQPAGVDLCSGVRDEAYRLDGAELRRFVRAALVAAGPVALPEGASVAELQRSVLLLEARMGWLDADLVHSAFRMVEEVGELHAAIRDLERARAKGGDLDPLRQAAGDEVVDVLNYLLAIANRLGIDVEQASRDKNLRNQSRRWSD